MTKCRFRLISETNALIVRAILIFMLQSLGESCKDIICSHVFDYVCGVAETSQGIQVLIKFQNICYLEKIRCQLKYILDIHHVADKLCNIENLVYYDSGRRVNDFSIVGAHQACNHTCPTFCTDSYNPACAQIWKRNMQSYSYRPMINHCHIDLFSCAVGVNVTIQPLGKCYKNPSGLLFMSQIAAMKSLRLLDDTPMEHRLNKFPAPITGSRRSNANLLEGLEYIVRRFVEKNNIPSYL